MLALQDTTLRSIGAYIWTCYQVQEETQFLSIFSVLLTTIFVCHYDHLRLHLINQMALSAGIEHDVYKDVTPLPEDDRERFYGDYYLELVEIPKQADKNDGCQCGTCAGSPTPL
jgi:hypothetical protein